ncbi:XRE family transcriptional regulator, partial [Eubacteriales bacterium OttesenSCG-928-K08]|nr:XRE family transcriptional regulator [Eubacteriales bacterium OttesenSCG-928-K08]
MIGSKIRQLRLNKSMTLSELAAKTQTTPGYISQLERDMVDPSLSTLRKVALALEAPIFTFLEENDRQSAVVYANNRQKIELPDTNVVYEFLTPMGSGQVASSNFLLLYHKLNPGSWSSEESVSHNAEECIYVLKGSLDIMVGGKVYSIDEG